MRQVGRRQRRRLPCQYAAGYLRQAGHSSDILPTIFARRKRKTRTLAPHRTRSIPQAELDERRISGLDDLNARLWAWLEQIYHRTAHAGLGGQTPLARYQRDLPRIRSLGAKAAQLDALFHHRIKRYVRKDGTVSYLGERFEVPYELAGKTVALVVDPHAARVVGVEDEAGNSLGQATALDAIANIRRKRRKPESATALVERTGPKLVEIAHAQYHGVAGVDHAANNVAVNNVKKKEA